MLQTPRSSFVSLPRDLSLQSPVSVTSCALGARTRNVTVRSECTSGDVGATGRVSWAAHADAHSRRMVRIFIGIASHFRPLSKVREARVGVAEVVELHAHAVHQAQVQAAQLAV